MYYVDRYLYQLVKEKDNFAPPERYYEYRKGEDNMVIETYIVSYNPLKLIDFSWTLFEGAEVAARFRTAFFKQSGLEHTVLYAYTVPPKWYEQEIAKVSK